MGKWHSAKRRLSIVHVWGEYLGFFNLPAFQVVLGRFDGSADAECCAVGGGWLLLPLGAALQSHWLLVKQESPWWYCVMRDSCHSRVRMCEMVISAAASPFYSLGLGLGLRHCHVVVAELEVLQLKQTMWQVAEGDNPLKSITKDRGFVLCTFCTNQKCKSFLFICHHMPAVCAEFSKTMITSYSTKPPKASQKWNQFLYFWASCAIASPLPAMARWGKDCFTLRCDQNHFGFW